MGTQKCDIRDSDNFSQARGGTQPSRVAIIGVIALAIGGLCAFVSFTAANTTLTTSRAQDNAMLTSVATGLVAFLFLWCAWRVLGRNGRVYAIVIGVANLLQLAPTIVAFLRR